MKILNFKFDFESKWAPQVQFDNRKVFNNTNQTHLIFFSFVRHPLYCGHVPSVCCNSVTNIIHKHIICPISYFVIIISYKIKLEIFRLFRKKKCVLITTYYISKKQSVCPDTRYSQANNFVIVKLMVLIELKVSYVFLNVDIDND